MSRRLFVVVLALAATAAQPTTTATANAPHCEAALAALRSREDALLAARRTAQPPETPDAVLAALQRDAARACLGRGAGTTLRSAPPAVAAPSPAASPTPLLLPRPPDPVPTGPVIKPAGPPVVVTGCDSGGCWTSDGVRLNRVGSNLVGPRGICHLVGTSALCP